MRRIDFKARLLEVLDATPRTCGQLAERIVRNLEAEGVSAFLDHHTLAANLRRLHADGVVDRVACPSSPGMGKHSKWRKAS